MKFNCNMSDTDFVSIGRYFSGEGVFVSSLEGDRRTSVALVKADARAFALEILRLCGDEQPAETPQAEPVPTKAIVVQRLTNGKLRPAYTPFVHDSVPAAIAEALRLAECNHTGSFVVFTPVAEAKATVTVDLTNTPTI